MEIYEIVFGIILIVAATFLIFAVLMQSGKAKKLSGTIAGGAETFFGKTKGKAIDKILSKLTTIIAVLFVILVVVLYCIQPKPNKDAEEGALDGVTPEVETQA
ncbi:MAG: preprotein translocase subunit SecG [Clostridia bacterium]|nr:preprotein translocase subunit SecG [Clostridia bacterium]